MSEQGINGPRARAAREALRLTQEDIAERMEVSVEFYSRIERGSSQPSIGTYRRMCHALRLDPGALFDHRSLTPCGPPISDPPTEVRRIIRRVRRAGPGALTAVTAVLRQFEKAEKSWSSARQDVVELLSRK